MSRRKDSKDVSWSGEPRGESSSNSELCPHPMDQQVVGGYVWRSTGKHGKQTRYKQVSCRKCNSNWEEAA